MKDLKGNKESFAHKTGDKIERAGDKLTNAGHDKMGRAVHNAGDKIEHLGENKKNVNISDKSKR
ncbi:MAG: hypothetical protein H7177_02625 [Rhizobacter sp.]|nr:hypothetical protein [Bacteriovorax sp.]